MNGNTYLHKKPYEEVVGICLELDAYIARSKKKAKEDAVEKVPDKPAEPVPEQEPEEKGSKK